MKSQTNRPHAGERTLPAFYYSQVDADRAADELKDKITALNDKLSILYEAEELGSLVQDNFLITPEQVTAVYSEKIRLSKGLPLTPEIIDDVVTEWKRKESTILLTLSTVLRIKKELERSGADVVINGARATITNKDEIIKAAAQIRPTNDDRELWRLLCNVRESYRRYSKFAEEHGKRSRLGIGMIMSVATPQQFIKEIALGHFDVSPTDEQLFRDDPLLVPRMKRKTNLITHENKQEEGF